MQRHLLCALRTPSVAHAEHVLFFLHGARECTCGRHFDRSGNPSQHSCPFCRRPPEMATTTQPRAFQHGEDRLVRYPYDSAHQVREGRLDIHISKCCKGNNRRTFLNCRLNSEHLVPADSLYEHLATCPDRGEGTLSSKSRQLPCLKRKEAI